MLLALWVSVGLSLVSLLLGAHLGVEFGDAESALGRIQAEPALCTVGHVPVFFPWNLLPSTIELEGASKHREKILGSHCT